MIGFNVRPVRPSQPNAEILNQLSKSVKSLRNMRPVDGAFGVMGLPWGQAITPGNANWVIAYTAESIPKATANGDGSLVLGVGNAYEGYPSINNSNGVVTLDYRENTGNPFPVYNIAKNADGDVAANRWIMAVRFWTLWIIIWEECPDS